jgi:hypothetical protein
MALRCEFRRVVVTVREGGAPAPAFQRAAELAHLLEIDLEGIFVEDEALFSLAGLPFARELRLPGHTWQSLDAGRMLEEFRDAAERARRLLADAAAALGMASGFSVLRGDLAALAAQSLATDILVVPLASAAMPGQLREAEEAAARSGAAIMLVPERPTSMRGPIAVVGYRAGGPSLAVAAAIARRAMEDVVLIQPGQEDPGGAETEAALKEVEFPTDRIRRRRIPTLTGGDVARALRGSNARLAVLDRAALPGDGAPFLSRLAAESAVPMLLVGEQGEAEEGAR